MYPHSLRQAMLFFAILPLLLAAAGGAWLGLGVLEEQLERRLQEDVELVARAIRLPLADALESGREEQVLRALESAFQIRRVYGAYVYDELGRRIAAVGAVEPREGEEAEVDEITGLEGRFGEYGEVGERRVYSYFVPLIGARGEPIGMLQVTRRRREMEEYLERWQRSAAWLIGGIVVLGAGLVLVGHHRAVGRPVARLVEGMRRVEAGESEHRVPVEPNPKEIGSIAAGLNRMLDGLARSEREVERRRGMELALQERLQRSERLASIGQLAAGVAHELGTPLGVVDADAQRALRDTELDPEERERWERVRGQVRRMDATVKQLLGISRREEAARRRMSVGRIVRGAQAAVRPVFEELGSELRVRSGEPSAEIVVDPPRLEQALANLLRNAAQADPGGSVRLRWRVSSDEISFVVEDDGPGIPPEERGRIFQPFFTTKAPAEGTGLGLALVQTVADEHDGEVRLEETDSGGARFILSVSRGLEGADA